MEKIKSTSTKSNSQIWSQKQQLSAQTKHAKWYNSLLKIKIKIQSSLQEIQIENNTGSHRPRDRERDESLQRESLWNCVRKKDGDVQEELVVSWFLSPFYFLQISGNESRVVGFDQFIRIKLDNFMDTSRILFRQWWFLRRIWRRMKRETGLLSFMSSQ